MNEQHELISRYSNKQEKYVYYIIALSVAAIGFSIHNTTDSQLSILQIPLGIAILLWSFCVYFGFLFIKRELDFIFTNNELFEFDKGRNNIAGDNIEKIELAKRIIRENLEDKSSKMRRIFKKIEYCFFGGLISYLIWHILEMSQR